MSFDGRNSLWRKVIEFAASVGLHWTEKRKLFITSYKEISDSIIEKDR